MLGLSNVCCIFSRKNLVCWVGPVPGWYANIAVPWCVMFIVYLLENKDRFIIIYYYNGKQRR